MVGVLSNRSPVIEQYIFLCLDVHQARPICSKLSSYPYKGQSKRRSCVARFLCISITRILSSQKSVVVSCSNWLHYIKFLVFIWQCCLSEVISDCYGISLSLSISICLALSLYIYIYTSYVYVKPCSLSEALWFHLAAIEVLGSLYFQQTFVWTVITLQVSFLDMTIVWVSLIFLDLCYTCWAWYVSLPIYWLTAETNKWLVLFR